MATYTQNLNLKKPSGTDYVAVGDFNGNTDTLDSVIGNPSQLTTPTKTNLVAAINEANSSGSNAPYIGENGNWFEWDPATSRYVDSGTRAEGPSGKNADIFAPKGTYATLSALNLAVTNPSQGDYYNVGTSAPYTIYMWDAAQGWLDQGQLQGPDGEPGKDGEPGAAGPNEITTGTKVGFNGIVKGFGGYATAAEQGIDFAMPVTTAMSLPESGTALSKDTLYPSTPVTNYAFVAPDGVGAWAHGVIVVGQNANITFTNSAGFVGGVPEFEAGKTYEFDVLNKIWAWSEVVSG